MKLFKVLLIALLSTFFMACEDEAQTVVKETPSFLELKEKKNEKVYALKTIEGKEIKFEYENKILTSKELNGKIVLLNFFATWCPPCKKEIPVFNKIAKMYPDEFIIISVLFQDPIEMIGLKEFIKEYKIEFPVTVGDENNRLAKDINNIKQIPESFLFTKDGILIEQFLGEVDEKILINYLEQLK